jgi:hypothetical protein
MQVEQIKETSIQIRYNADILPACPTCGVRCRSKREIGAMIGVSEGLVYYWHRVHGLKSISGIYREGKRQGTDGVTAQYYCLDEVNMWLIANPLRLKKRVPASWSVVRDDDGRAVSAIPSNVSPLHLTPETYGEFSIDLVAKLNEGLV